MASKSLWNKESESHPYTAKRSSKDWSIFFREKSKLALALGPWKGSRSHEDWTPLHFGDMKMFLTKSNYY